MKRLHEPSKNLVLECSTSLLFFVRLLLVLFSSHRTIGFCWQCPLQALCNAIDRTKQVYRLLQVCGVRFCGLPGLWRVVAPMLPDACPVDCHALGIDRPAIPIFMSSRYLHGCCARLRCHSVYSTLRWRQELQCHSVY